MRQFLTALTRGGGSLDRDISAPIEMQSNDPIRYTGDMLAWIHQSFDTTNEKINMIFQNKNTNDEVLEKDVMAHIYDGVARTLQVG